MNILEMPGQVTWVIFSERLCLNYLARYNLTTFSCKFSLDAIQISVGYPGIRGIVELYIGTEAFSIAQGLINDEATMLPISHLLLFIFCKCLIFCLSIVIFSTIVSVTAHFSFRLIAYWHIIRKCLQITKNRSAQTESLPLAMGQYVPSDHRAEANLRRQQKKFVERSISLSFLGTESGAEQGTEKGNVHVM